MPRIYVEFSGLEQIGSRCKTASSKVTTIQSDFQRTVRQLDWDIRFESNINSTATKIAKTLEQYSRTLETYQRFIEDALNEYVKLDEYKKTNLIDYISSIRVDPNVAVILGPGGNPFANWKDRISEIVFDTDEEKDLLSTVKTLLRGTDKWGDVDEAGVLEDVISYFESFTTFFSGDKKGLTGASDWCNLADSSIGVWTGLYDYF